MKEPSLENITGRSSKQQLADDVANLEERNPLLAEPLKRLLARAQEKEAVKKFIVTPAIKAGARANARFHEHRLQDE